jgi:2'-5' RNA ligase
MTDNAPLILTLQLDPASFARLDGLRRAYFPPALNRLHAHLTLFHALPAAAEPEVSANLAVLAAASAPLPLRFAGLRGLGRGVAYAVESPELMALRGLLAKSWHGWLTQQDRQGYRPHVTVQNKVEPAIARELQAELEAGFTPWEGRGEALLLWRYRDREWVGAGGFPFAGIASASGAGQGALPPGPPPGE